MGEIKTDLFPGNLRAGKRSGRGHGALERDASSVNKVVSVEQLKEELGKERSQRK